MKKINDSLTVVLALILAFLAIIITFFSIVLIVNDRAGQSFITSGIALVILLIARKIVKKESN